jgi:hypothetical protein
LTGSALRPAAGGGTCWNCCAAVGCRKAHEMKASAVARTVVYPEALFIY